MTMVFHARLYEKIIEMKRKFRRARLVRASQDSNFHGGSFSNRNNVRDPIQFKRENKPSIVKGDFSSCTDSDSSIIASIEPIF